MTTERVLPAVAIPAPARPRSLRETSSAPGAVIRPAVRRKQAFLSTPARAGMLIGASATIYSVALAGIAAVQSQGDLALAAHNAPYLDAAAATRAANDSLEAAIVRIDGEARALADEYAGLGQDMTGYQARLDELAALVAEIQGSVAALPTRISLPSVSMRGAVGGSGRAPATTTKTAASGAP
jgi:hypothetical protein